MSLIASHQIVALFKENRRMAAALLYHAQRVSSRTSLWEGWTEETSYEDTTGADQKSRNFISIYFYFLLDMHGHH